MIRLGITGKLKRTLQSTNPCESMISTVRIDPPQRQALELRRDVPAVDRRRDARSREAGSARCRATAASPRLAVAIEQRPPPSPPEQHRPTEEAADGTHCVTITPGPPSPKFHDERGNLCVGDKADFRRAAVSGPLLAESRARIAASTMADLHRYR